LDIAVSYLPMTSVAGDFYDFLIVDEHRLGILVADVAGHGVPAALIASMVKVAITAQAAHADDPGLVLSGLNQVLCSQMSGQFVTAAYVFVDSDARVARYAAAGHPPLLLWRKAAGTVERHSENGLFLGFRASERYGSLSIPLDPGDRILLYTDGLVEAESARGEFFGETRFAELIRAHPDSAAADLVDAILKSLPVWTAGRAQADDLTLLVAGLRA
jgi:serine phosphatase RsbU (regulator of sigma subunit)